MNLLKVFLSLIFSLSLFAESPLKPVKTESPRGTMKSFMFAMADYKKGLESGDQKLQHRIFDAVRTLDLDSITHTDKKKFGKEAAIYLKETMDRVILIDFALIPGDGEMKNEKRWRLKDTEITIARIGSGSREGEYLFTKDSILRAKSFYNRVKHLEFKKGSGEGAGFKTPWYERQFPGWLTSKSFFLPNWQIVGILFSILMGFILKSIATFMVDQLKRLTEKSANPWDDKVIEVSEVTVGSIVACLFWILSIRLLGFEGNIFLVFDIVLKLILSYYLIKLAYQLVDVFASFLADKASHTEFPLDDQLVPMIRKSLRIFTIAFGVLVSVQNLGVNVMSVLAGLGLGGLAFALAAKDACANLFGSVMILMDKPFRVGDWITTGGVDGTVEEIGFRSTKVRTFHSSLVSIPNSKLANQNIDNMGRRKFRRIRAMLGLTYDATPEQMEAFLEGTKNIVKANKSTVKDNFHVVFHSYGDSSLNVLLYCFLDVKDWAEEMVERQNIYLEILRLAKSLGVSFAFPSQSLYVHNMSDEKLKEYEDQELKDISSSYLAQGKNAKPEGMGIFTPLYKE